MKEIIPIKTKEEIDKMKKGGKIAARALLEVGKNIKPGITTSELDQVAERFIKCHGGEVSFKGFSGYPATTCISINDEVVHGIPSNRVIKAGDIVGVDLGVYFEGYHTDTAITLGVGKIAPKAQRLIDITKRSLDNAIKAIKPGKHLGDISILIQKVIEDAGFGVVRDLTGHGVGRQLQEPPTIPNFGKKDQGPIIKEGMTLAIEPMVTAGDWHVVIKPDGWTVVTADKSLAAHFEHTIAVSKTGAVVLTKIK